MKDKLTFEQECKLIANGEDLPKEKQIEKMAKRIHIATDLYYIECIKIATYLFEKDNCRIIDKDSVVLSREEWRECIDNENEAYYRGQHEAEVYYKNIQIPRERKETAEKILNEIKAMFIGTNYNVDWIVNKLEAFANREGVEIKE